MDSQTRTWGIRYSADAVIAEKKYWSKEGDSSKLRHFASGTIRKKRRALPMSYGRITIKNKDQL